MRTRPRSVAVVTLSTLALSLWAVHAHAQPGGPAVQPPAGGTAPAPGPTPVVAVSRDALEYTFAESMTFTLEATSDRPIDEVILRYTIGGGDDLPRNRRIPAYTGGTTIEAAHTEELARGQIPPASPITWWWALSTADGAAFETAPQTARYLDQSFDWQSTDGDDVRVWWYDASPEFADEIAASAREALAELGELIGGMPDRRVEIVAYRSQDDLRPALMDRGGTYETRLATLGALVAEDTLVLDAGSRSEDLFEVVKHELSHLVLHLRLADDYVGAPSWLDEGLAMYVEGELESDEQAMLDAAVRDDDLMSVRSLTSFPGDATLVPLAYAQSRDFIRFLVDTYGLAQFQALIDALASGELTAEQALVDVYGFDQLGLYQRYREAYGLAPAATPNPTQIAEARIERAERRADGLPAAPCASIILLLPAGLAAACAGRRR